MADHADHEAGNSSNDNWYRQDESPGQSSRPAAKSGRRWWLLGCLIPLPILLCAGVCGGFVFFVFGLLKSSDPYVESLAAAQGNAELIAEIGQPIEAGWLVSGEVRLNNDNGHADVNYSVSGPQGTAEIRVVADKQAGVWSYTHMQATLRDTGKVIDLRPQP